MRLMGVLLHIRHLLEASICITLNGREWIPIMGLGPKPIDGFRVRIYKSFEDRLYVRSSQISQI